MPKVPRVSGKEARRAFECAGFVLDRINGSHHILKKNGHKYHLSIPVHKNDILGTGLLKALIEASGMTIEEFTQNLE